MTFLCKLNWFKAQSSFSPDRSKTGPSLQFFFVRASVVSYVTFVFHYLFLISPTFGTSGSLYFVTAAFPWYL